MNSIPALDRRVFLPTWLRVLRATGTTILWLILVPLTLWAVAALYVDIRIAALAVTLYEVGKMFDAPGVSRLPTDGTAGLIVRTALGPVFLGGSVGDTGHAKWFFALGRVF